MSGPEELLNQLKARIRPFLRHYLESRNVHINEKSFFLCLNPAHNESDASGHIVPETSETYWTCFGCGASGDIFTAAHYLEGFPLVGKEFLEYNVYQLAARFRIEFEKAPMSEHDIYLMHLRQLYRHAANTLVEFHHNRSLLEARGWSPALCHTMGVATVDSWEAFRARLAAKAGCNLKFMEDAGIDGKLFNPYCITFTLFDEFGNPIGFAARDSRWDAGKQNVKKYRNTSNKIPVFKKSRILYGFHLIKDKPIRPTLVEGYADVLTALHHGIEGFVALMGTEQTDDQVELLQKYSKTDILLALDYDAASSAGQNRTQKYLDEVLSGKRNLRISVIDLAKTTTPDISTDPDRFLSNNADPRNAWAALPREDAFGWRLQRIAPNVSPEAVCESMVKLIVNEPQHARQDVMLKQLSEYLPVREAGIRLETLRADLDDLLYVEDRRRRDQAEEILSKTQKDLRYANPVESDKILDDAARQVRELRRDTKAVVNIATSLEMVDAIQAKFWDKGEGLPGHRTGFSKMDERMGGLPKEDCFWVMGGIPHVGKTSWLSHLAWNLGNYNDDICVCFFSIDDAMSQIYPKFVALDTGIFIRHVAQPRRYIKDQPTLARLNGSWQKVRFLLQSGRLEVRDSTFGRSVNYLISWVEHKQKQFPNRHIVAILDNLHKLGGSKGENIRERFRDASEQLKTLSQSGGVTVMATAELKKAADRMRPTLQDLLETGQIEHDATVAAIFHNDLQVKQENSDLVWIDKDDPDEPRKAVTEIFVDKNKSLEGAWKGTLRYQFNGKLSRFIEVQDDYASPPEVAQPAGVVSGGPPTVPPRSGQAQPQPTQTEMFPGVKP
jgi:DNA primase catalytic core